MNRCAPDSAPPVLGGMTHQRSTRFIAFAALLLAAAPLCAQSVPTPKSDDAVGTWAIEEKTSWIRIERSADGALLGRLVWLTEPNEADGRPKLDINNPDKSLRSRPIHGMPILQGFVLKKPGAWSDGRIYDGRDGKSYRGIITMAGSDTLKLRGYIKIGFLKLGRTSEWTRVRTPVAPDSGSTLFKP